MNAFAILAHRNPERLYQLIESLSGENIFLHLDKASNREEMIHFNRMNKYPNLFIIPPDKSIKVSWGGFSVVRAQLELLRTISNHEKPFTKIIFLSGEDYPLRPIREFIEYVSEHENLLSLHEITPDLAKGPNYVENRRIRRVSKIHVLDLRICKAYKGSNQLLNKLFRLPSSLVSKLGIANPHFDPTRKYFVGSQWIAISINFAKFLLENEFNIAKEFKYSFAPDELAFQTFYGRMLKPELKNEPNFDSVIHASYHIVPPSFTIGGSEWHLDQLNLILGSEKFFIRKPSLEVIRELRKVL
jgi:hypothetical protein